MDLFKTLNIVSRSVLGILNEKGELLNRYLSDPFGKTISSTETVSSKFTFVGQWGVVRFEELDGAFYMRSRFYDSETGRFFSIDSFGIKAHSKNFYVYCSNSPVHFNDPGGNCPLCIGALVGSAKSLISYGMSTPFEDWTLGGKILSI
jgi:RHS repeat-associated protein